MGRDLTFDSRLLGYVAEHTAREPEIFRRLRKETDALGEISAMQIGWVQARFMQVLARAMGARRYLEVGVFTGYSALAMAQILPKDGRITAIDVSEEWTAMGRKYWKEAGVEEKIDLVLDDAKQVLERLKKKNAAPYDIVFIDADKENLDRYFELCLALVRQGGLVIVDNVLWSGSVASPEDTRDSTQALRAFNRRVVKDRRVITSMIPVGDGLSLSVKK